MQEAKKKCKRCGHPESQHKLQKSSPNARQKEESPFRGECTAPECVCASFLES
jgi:hypothetical protein